MPDATGQVKLIDECHSDHKSPYCMTVRHDQIKFHQPDAENFDYLVKCYLIMIVAIDETQFGMSNLWARGRSRGRREYPNFGKDVACNVLKEFFELHLFLVIRSSGTLTKRTENRTHTCLHLKSSIRKGKI